MPRWLKNILGVLLIPLCLGVSSALGQVFREMGSLDLVWAPLLAGAACWMIIYLLLPQPFWIYVVAHELTHVAAAWLCGGKVKRLRVRAGGGEVWVSKTNWFIALAPYFIPFYTLCALALFLAGNYLLDWRGHLFWLHFFLGFTYTFHLTFTLHALSVPQSDLAAHGYFFSLPVIWLGNVALLAAGLALMSDDISLGKLLEWSWTATIRLVEVLRGFG
jgi:hypothetical protein